MEKPSITTLVLGEGVNTIEANAFKDCTGIKSVTMPYSLKTIGDYAFWNCSGIENLELGNNVNSIGVHAFNSCYGITTVTIPRNVRTIGRNAFFDCRGLRKVYSQIDYPFDIDKTVFMRYDESADDYVFTNAILTVPKGAKERYAGKEGWKEFRRGLEDGQEPGDVNGDFTVDVADIGSVIDVMAKGNNDPSADVNGDGSVDVADIATIIDEMAARVREQKEIDE